MPKVVVRKCRSTGKLFEDNTKFAKHLRKVRVELHANIKLRQAIRVMDDVWASIRQLDNIPDIMQAFWDNYHILGWRGYHTNRFHVKLPSKLPGLIRLGYQLNYSPNVSISHSAPIGVRTNFSGVKCFRKFPGFVGRFDAEYSEDYGEAGLSRICGEFGGPAATGFNTGTGGGGYRRVGYELRLYLDDFPNLKKRIEEQMLVNRLTDGDLIYTERHSAIIRK